MRSLIDMMADRGAFIDQSASLNLFMESPNIGKLSSMYMYAWQKGLKTTYYLRSRPATRIAQVTAEYKAKDAASDEPDVRAYTDERSVGLFAGKSGSLRGVSVANIEFRISNDE